MSGSERIVTPKQYADGYYEKRGMLAYHRKWILIRKLDDGNYLVVSPSPRRVEGL